ncbi:hypothetical protein [Streptomyces klenkii]
MRVRTAADWRDAAVNSGRFAPDEQLVRLTPLKIARGIEYLRDDQHRNRALCLACVVTVQLARSETEEVVDTALKVATMPAVTAGRTFWALLHSLGKTAGRT